MCMGHTEDGIRLRTDLRQALRDPTLEVGENGDTVSLAEEAVYSADAEDAYESAWEDAESDWFSQGLPPL